MKRHKQLTGQNNVPVSSHIKELRNRLSWVAGFFMIGAIVGYVYQVNIIAFLNQYMQSGLYYTSPAGNFNFIMKVSVMSGVMFAIPVAVYQMIKFTQPALTARHQYKRAWLVAILSFVLALTGMAFAMWVLVPMSLRFFAGFNVNGIQPLISADEYLTYVTKALLWFGILFQIPLLLLFINKVTPLKPRKLLKYEKYVIVGALVIALVLPFTYDPITQFIIAIPIVILYNISVILIWLSNKSDAKQAYKEQLVTQAYQKEQAKIARYKAPKTPVIISHPKPKLNVDNNTDLKPQPKIKPKPKINNQKTKVISDFGFTSKTPTINKIYIK